MIEVPYLTLKNLVVTNSLPLQHFLVGTTYFVYAINGNFLFYCKFDDDSPEASDFNASLAPLSNKRLFVDDADGATVVRIKAAKAGWTYNATAFSFQTSKLNSLDGDTSIVSIKFFKSNGEEVTSVAEESLITTTKLKFFPPYSYEIIGGFLHCVSPITENVKLKIIGVPSVPPAYGGSKALTSNLNLRYIKGQVLQIDGRVTKYMEHPYSDIDFEFTHPQGYVVDLQITVEVYKQ